MRFELIFWSALLASNSRPHREVLCSHLSSLLTCPKMHYIVALVWAFELTPWPYLYDHSFSCEATLLTTTDIRQQSKGSVEIILLGPPSAYLGAKEKHELWTLVWRREYT